MTGLVDNDVLLKGACYGLLTELLGSISSIQSIGILGSAQFVVPTRIHKRKLKTGTSQAIALFQKFLASVSVVEPTSQEQHLAADLEIMAQRLGLSLDSGESQLCAVLAIRLLPLLITGDKRAISSVDMLLDHDANLRPLRGKVMCLEQLFLALLKDESTGVGIRTRVCAEPDVDKAMSSCFSCSGGVDSKDSQMEGLRSYIERLRTTAPRVLGIELNEHKRRMVPQARPLTQ